jgi:hypothetical protein
LASIRRSKGSLGSANSWLVGGVAGVELALELVQRSQAVAFELVAEDVDQPREAIDSAEMGPQAARKEERGHGEVLSARPAGNG